ncbi:MAG TPA: alpha/beta hydrolase [Thermoanaerobaculia bacterium]|jgi:pimeloyl-ACP methyl ester carboxylesterase|nr:alpha/beta hydrolase [Thermoanaerobaculia bacterium]
MNIRRTVLATALGTGIAVLAAGAAFAGPYQIIATAESRPAANLVRAEYTVKVGAHPLDRFKMVRVAREVPASQLRGSILLLPPLGPPFSFYEQRDPNGAPGSSIAEYLALRGFDVYGYSPRFEGIPAGTCEAGVLDCSALAGWNLQSMVDDITFVRSQIEALHPGTRIVTGGASLGGMLALAVANAHPGDWDGIIPWEGMLYSQDPQVLAINQGYCTVLQAQLAAGLLYDGLGGNVIKMAVEMVRTNPGGLTPIPLFPPTLTNHQTLVAILSTPNPTPATMPAPNYVLMNGSLAEDRFFNASEPRVIDSILRFTSYAPLPLVRDISCSLAGVETRYTSNLGNFHGAVLAIGGGRGFGPYMGDQLAQTGSSDVTFLFEPTFGHIDHFMTARHRDFVERPIEEWAARVLGR